MMKIYSGLMGNYKNDLSINNIIKKVKNLAKTKITIEYIQNWIKEQNCSTIILSDVYINNKSPILMKCECGKTFSSFWNRMKNINKCRCNECGEKIRTRRKYKTNDIEKELMFYGYRLLNKDFNNIHSIDVKDDEDYLYHTDLHRLRRQVFPFRFSVSNKYLSENIKNYIIRNKINVEFISLKINSKNTIDCVLTLKCKCGEIFNIPLHDFLYNNRYRCKKCSRSKSILELKIEEYLKEKGVRYITQHCFEDCKNIRKLKYDFYLPQYNLIIEVNGQQHYYEQKDFTLSLEEQIKRDEYKKAYCLSKGIKYIQIPFWYIYNKNTYKTIIDKSLK